MEKPHAKQVRQDWYQLVDLLTVKRKIELKGNALTIPAVYAASLLEVRPSIFLLSSEIQRKIYASVQFVDERLEHGESIYGVTTGFGGSADVHTTNTRLLQVALIQMQLSAVLPSTANHNSFHGTHIGMRIWRYDEQFHKLGMPEAWVRGAILVRCNSLLRGHSAVRIEVVQGLLRLLEDNLIPLVPLRGSISASGDLCPLSYVAGVLEGNPDIRVWAGAKDSRHLITADEALLAAGITPVRFGPKETLGLINGTAVSVAIASIAQHEADMLMVLAQVLTAMAVEATTGCADDFDPFFGVVRPHPGQIEIAANIASFLQGSSLTRTISDEKSSETRLRQDRYALRTSAQWLGPFLEDMKLARDQLAVELNSTTDNPLVDTEGGRIHHGGNFQATAVTSATDKVRTALEKIGKMIFAQSTELLDYKLNHNLPPNLAVDDPSLSFSMKGIDINMAAYMSELSFLANPVSSHVLCAEMGNQAVNSLALISARYTHIAVDLVSLMSSAYIYTLCQALDLRAMHKQFMSSLKPAMDALTASTLQNYLSNDKIADVQQKTLSEMISQIASTTSMDASRRFVTIARAIQPHLIDVLESIEHEDEIPGKTPLNMVASWSKEAAELAETLFRANRKKFLANPDATQYLGAASKRVYTFVRDTLKVPMHKGLVDHPTVSSDEPVCQKKNTGTQISIIYKSIRDGSFSTAIMDCLELAIDASKEIPSLTPEL